jgi:hypothetical protein
LHECAAAQGDDPGASAAQFGEQMLQCIMLRAPEGSLAGIAEDFGDAAAFASGDAVVQIFKDPIQPVPEGAAYAGLTRSHKANEEDSSRLKRLGRP